MDKIYLSPSSLASWYDMGCPAQWQFNRDWEPLEPNPVTEFGTKVHRMLEEPDYAAQEVLKDRRAESYYRKIKFVRDSITSEVLHTELRQRFNLTFVEYGDGLTCDVMWGRRIDLIATLRDGSTAIIDYKTHLGRGWRSLKSNKKDVYPQSLGFQSMGYMAAPPDIPEGLKEWPKTVIYIVGSLAAQAQVIRVDYTAGDMDTFLELVESAASIMAHSNYVPRPGKHCHDCRFAAMCYNQPGWRKMYKKREHSGNK